MTIDEKLERLTERTEAIALSVELLTSLHRDLEQATAKELREMRTTMAERFAETNTRPIFSPVWKRS
jgi:archaellum component FlaC